MTANEAVAPEYGKYFAEAKADTITVDGAKVVKVEWKKGEISLNDTTVVGAGDFKLILTVEPDDNHTFADGLASGTGQVGSQNPAVATSDGVTTITYTFTGITA